jgi:NTE family protein
MPDEMLPHSIELVGRLRESRLCDGLTDEQVLHVAEYVEVRPFKAGEQLGASGEKVTHLFILADGQIKASTRNAKGQEILVGYMNPGDHAGDVPLLENSPRPVDLTALADGTLLRVTAPSFHLLIDTYPRMLRNLFRTLGMRFKEFAGVLKRRIPSPVLGIVGIWPSGNTLCQRLFARLAADGERLTIWTNDPERLKLDSECPQTRRLDESAVAEIERFRRDGSAELERHVIVLLADSWSNVDPRWMRLTNET